MAYKIHPLDAEACDICGRVTFAWVQPCQRCKDTASPVDIAWVDDNDGCGPRKLQNSIRCF
jgi:hypothetical protein